MFVVEGMDTETLDVRFAADDGTSADCVYMPRQNLALVCEDWS